MTGTLNLGVGFAESEAGFGFGGGAKLFGGGTGGVPVLARGIGLVGTVGLVGRASVGEEIGLGGAIGRAGATGKAEDAGIAGALVVVRRTGTLKTGPFLVPTALVPPALCVGAALRLPFSDSVSIARIISASIALSSSPWAALSSKSINAAIIAVMSSTLGEPAPFDVPSRGGIDCFGGKGGGSSSVGCVGGTGGCSSFDFGRKWGGLLSHLGGTGGAFVITISSSS
jgi:hypothetical protein